ncbi:hypothetical protein CLU83_1948 [Flavobacterium sp. 1]|uniref:hypothetical protein n=1 Tax=Flavobacterium sp. 1 TaxID=2035200 RepID=UPI000C23B0D7|nr:hypothetical protein [Flavobacterium sp. 1]PJJ08662.1 hypothetical protein CLU83_1948 [Flavobacterium sp. 1]
MSTDHNRIKVADLEINEPNKTLITNDNGELEFSDITGGSQNLQQTLDNGPSANFDGDGSSSVVLGGGTPFNRYAFMSMQSAGGASDTNSSSIFLDKLNLRMEQGTNSAKSTLYIESGILKLTQSSSYSNRTNFIFDTPIAQTTLKLPAKSTGNYTLATTSDINAIDLDKVVQNGYLSRYPFGVGVHGISPFNNLVMNDGLQVTRFPEFGGGTVILHLLDTRTTRPDNGFSHFYLPAKAEGFYTLATLDDIAGGVGSQNLQSVLDTENSAEGSIVLTHGNKTVEMSPGDLSINMSNGTGQPSFSLTTSSSMYYTTADKAILLDFNRASTGTASFGYPDKPTGSYTLATLDDIISTTPTLDQVLEAGDTATDKNFEIKSTAGSGNEEVFIDGQHIVVSNFDLQKQLGMGYNYISSNDNSTKSNTLNFDRSTIGYSSYYFPEKPTGTYTLATLDDIPTIVPSSATVSGIVNNTLLQELGGVDKTINGVRIGKGNSTGADNTVLGFNSQTVSTTAAENTSAGFESLRDVTTGGWNSAFGVASLRANTTATQNTAFGYATLRANTTGSINSAFGSLALMSNTIGTQNLGMGAASLGANIDGNYNLAMGALAGRYITNSSMNTLVGAAAGGGTGSNFNKNTAIGYLSQGGPNNTGTNNITIGYESGYNITTGSYNIILGTFPSNPFNVSTGNYNTVINPVFGTTQAVTTGSNNVVIGSAAVSNNLTNSVVISDNNGAIALFKASNNTLTANTQTNALITSDTTGKAILTKEYLAARIGTAAPTSSADSGTAGEIRLASGYVYWYVAGTGWLRSAGATF